MPELPEIEALRRYLEREKVPGRRIVDVDAWWPGIERSSDGKGGLAKLPGRRIERLERRGKQLIARLDRGTLGLHMGMTGRLAVMGADDPPLRYARSTLHLDDGRRLELDDVRRWASIQLVEDAGQLTDELGPDALDPKLTPEVFAERVATRRSQIKAALLDQHVVAGIGNVYADEALFRAGISPRRQAGRISAERVRALHREVRATLEDALRYIESHPDDRGRPFTTDTVDERMRLPRRKKAPCPRCDAPLQSAKVGGRTSYYCRQCQR